MLITVGDICKSNCSISRGPRLEAENQVRTESQSERGEKPWRAEFEKQPLAELGAPRGEHQ